MRTNVLGSQVGQSARSFGQHILTIFCLMFSRRCDIMLALLLLTIFAHKGTGQTCPERNGRFPHPTQCDAYTDCEDGVPLEKLCPDGLLFNPNVRFFAYPCQYPVEVNCTGRPNIQTARSTEECPHAYGYYKVGDEKICGQFINCVEGKAFHFDCPEGLAFDEVSLRCDWPDQVSSCDAEAYLGFSCPASEGAFSSPEFQSYRSPYDCSKFFICIAGKPRAFSCPEGKGFTDETGTCENEEDVPGCLFAGSQEPSFIPPGRSQNDLRSLKNRPNQ